jgi:hypothetical protein
MSCFIVVMTGNTASDLSDVHGRGKTRYILLTVFHLSDVLFISHPFYSKDINVDISLLHPSTYTFSFHIYNPSCSLYSSPPPLFFWVPSFSCLNMITPQRGRFRISLNLCEMLNVVRRENQNNNIVTSGGRFNHSRATNCRELNIFCGKKRNMPWKFLQYL